jgi:type IX secretion system PorP/SprF family membrane protein
MKKIFFISVIMVSMLTKIKAQDIHYSQFFTSPISLNPAKTGLFNGDWRMGGNYKNQWYNIPVTYHTASIFVDKNFGEARNKQIKKAGAGLFVVQDIAGDGNLATTKIQFSGAYHQLLDYNERFYLSGGISGGWVQKQINFTKLYWGNQWIDDHFDKQIDPNQPIKKSVINYLELNAGAEFTAIIDGDRFFHAGISAFHLNKPTETFYQNNNTLGIKPILNVGYTHRVDYNYELFTEFYFSYQKKATEKTLSVIGGYNLKHSSLFNEFMYIGLIYRYKDAMVPIVGYAKNNYRVYLNYDINLSKLTRASFAQGGVEISFQYTYSKTKAKFRAKIPCSVF